MPEIQRLVRRGGRLADLRLEAARYWQAARSRVRDEGLLATASAAARLGSEHLTYRRDARALESRTFEVDGARLQYVASRWNNTWLNERAVEIAIANRFLERTTGELLEVGNVMAHYGRRGHTVLDLHEGLPGIINADVRTWAGPARYPRILSISTIEHVGWDDPVKDPDGAVSAIANLRAHLAPGGSMLVTVPLGYNPHLDAALQRHGLGFDRAIYLRRASAENEWVETGAADALAAPYRRGAQGLLVGIDGPARLT